MSEHEEHGESPTVEPEATVERPSAGWYNDPEDPGGAFLRFWDGSSWTDHRCSPQGSGVAGPPGSGAPSGFRTVPADEDERRGILARQVQASVVRGLRVESQDRYQVILIEGQPVNHVLHAILTLGTCGLWGIVWAILAATGGEKRHLISVDDYGNVLHQQLGRA